MYLISDTRLQGDRHHASANSYRICQFFPWGSRHGLYEGVRFSPPFPAYVKDKGVKASARVSQMHALLASLEAAEYTPPSPLGFGCDHRHVNTHIAEPGVGENDV